MLAHLHDDPGRLTYRDGGDVQDGSVASFYFSDSSSWATETVEILERLTDHEPILDVGCGAGTHLLWWADRDVEAIGVDVSPNAISTARERGCERVCVGDMHTLPVATDSVGAVHAVGTQLGLGRSLAGVRAILEEFDRVSHESGIAVVDNYDPTRLDESFLGYRSDPREGIAHRCFHLEFERESESDDEPVARHERREIGRTLQFLLCSPERLREATGGTPWVVTDVLRSPESAHYRAVLKNVNRRGAETKKRPANNDGRTVANSDSRSLRR
ncbi:class I SAM-dependent methyltransferase [Natrialba sp. SSL1]|uniref:class I SAM-dependent methyltransferase n=1 Tax=Natrialba sp. SSL1 TaxID=1869245 RepID=UPI00209B817E|nr:class I SAM-dependent methyltransferase [Natrialba sp. SSL1]